MKVKFTLLLMILVVSFGYTQMDFETMMDNPENDLNLTPNPEVAASPDYVTQRLVSKTSTNSPSYDSTAYFYAEADDGFAFAETRYNSYDTGALKIVQLDTLVYDAQDREISRTSYAWSNSNQEFYKNKIWNTTYTGLSSTRIEQHESGNTFENYKKVEELNFPSGDLQEKSEYNWNDTIWVLNKYDKYSEEGWRLERIYEAYYGLVKRVYHRQADGNLIDITYMDFDDQSGTYVNDARQVYVETTDTTYVRYYQKWNGSEWHGTSKLFVTTDLDGNHLHSLKQDSVGVGQYVNVRYYKSEYAASGLLSFYRSSNWDSDTEKWVSGFEYTADYDGNGNFKNETYFQWNVDSAKVVPWFGYEYQFDMNSNQTFKRDLKWDLDLGDWEETASRTWHYEDYENGLVGIKALDQVVLKVFPNPCTDYVSFRMKNGLNNFKVSFYSAQGALLFSVEATDNQQISVSRLPSGMYYYIIKGDGVGATGKFVKE